MAGQAGWYPAPGEAGLVRYWNGTEWTDHRQPMPVAADTTVVPPVEPVAAVETPPVIATVPSSVLDTSSGMSATELAMIEFEKQFEQQAAEQFALANAQPQSTIAEASPAPSPVPAPSRFAPTPVPETPVAEIPAPQTFAAQTAAPEKPVDETSAPATVADMWSSVSDQIDAMPAPAAQAPPVSTVAAPALLLAPAPTSAPPVGAGTKSKARKKGMSGGARGMLIGILVVVLGLGAFGYLAFQALPEAGEAIAAGVVTDLGSSTGSSGATCAPVARFAITGKSYTATTSVPAAACPVTLGQSVNVIYDVKAPTTSGRIQVPGPYALLVWLLPLTGLIVFVASLIAFMRTRSKAAPIS